MPVGVSYLYDDGMRRAANARGENYWYCYVEEILDELGIRAEALPFPALQTDRLDSLRALILGDYDASLLPTKAGERLQAWVESGGTLIGFKTTGLDGLFGISSALPDVEVAPFTIAAWMSLNGCDEASGLLGELLPETDFPVMSPFRRLVVTDATALTQIVEAEPKETSGRNSTNRAFPALTRRGICRGRAYYFAFNLPQAVWTYHQGRPITQDFDGDGYLRTGDAIIVRSGRATTVPCADLVLVILENILAPAGIPFVHQLPPFEGDVPDALFHYGGDDEAQPGLQVKMSNLFKTLGLPYHVNVMLGKDDSFHFTDPDRAVYEENAHEFSMHFNFINYPRGVTHPAPIDEPEYDRQLQLFINRFGKVPVCANFHFCGASGWADAARFGARRGVRGDNSFAHHTTPPMDPVNLFGAPFGTVYPYFVYDDAEHGNERLDFVNIPIGFYEPGSFAYEESHPLHGQDPFRPKEYRRIVDLACRYSWTLNLFKHPTHMFHPRSCGEEALRCMLERIRETGAHVLHVGTDALCLWWHARSRTRLERSLGEDGYIVDTPHGQGVLIRFLKDALPPNVSFELDGKVAPARKKERGGRKWLYVLVPRGKHVLRVSGSSPV